MTAGDGALVWMPNARPVARPGLIWRRVGAELVVWDDERRTAHLLDPVAALVWPLLDGSASLDQLADDVASVWGVDRVQVLSDIGGLMQALATAGLVAESVS